MLIFVMLGYQRVDIDLTTHLAFSWVRSSFMWSHIPTHKPGNTKSTIRATPLAANLSRNLAKSSWS